MPLGRLDKLAERRLTMSRTRVTGGWELAAVQLHKVRTWRALSAHEFIKGHGLLGLHTERWRLTAVSGQLIKSHGLLGHVHAATANLIAISRIEAVALLQLAQPLPACLMDDRKITDVNAHGGRTPTLAGATPIKLVIGVNLPPAADAILCTWAPHPATLGAATAKAGARIVPGVVL